MVFEFSVVNFIHWTIKYPLHTVATTGCRHSFSCARDSGGFIYPGGLDPFGDSVVAGLSGVNGLG